MALALLAVGFGMIVEAHSRAAMATVDARNVTIGTTLARGKMLDVEYEIKKDGFADYDKVIEGDFSEEGYPDFKYTAVLRKIEVPTGKITDFSAAAGAVGSLLGEGASSALGGGGSGGQQGGGAQGALGMMGPILETAANVVNAAVREMTLDVKLPEGGRLEHIKVATHLVDDVKLAAELGKIGAMNSNLAGLGNMLNNNPLTGNQQQNQPPHNQQNPRKDQGANPVLPTPEAKK